MRGRLLLSAAVVAGLASCATPAPHPASPRASATPAPAATAAGLAAWQQKGATEAPPASLRDTGLGGVQVVNQTGGAVSDADAARWAAAYVRANAYEFWAWNHLQDAFLQRSGLSQVPLSVFGYDLTTIGQARAAGVRLEVTRLALAGWSCARWRTRCASSSPASSSSGLPTRSTWTRSAPRS